MNERSFTERVNGEPDLNPTSRSPRSEASRNVWFRFKSQRVHQSERAVFHPVNQNTVTSEFIRVLSGWGGNIMSMMRTIHDRLYDALAHKQRRRVLFALLEESPRTTVPIDLHNPPASGIQSEADRIAQIQIHLPKLDDYGFIEWRSGMSFVKRGILFDEISPALELLKGYHEDVSA